MIRALLVIAALLGAAGVAIGAFGAHGISNPHARELIETGARWHMIHVLAALIAAQVFNARWSASFFLAGIVLFAGSLYALAFGAPRIVGAITPIGGALFIAGWMCLALDLLRARDAS